MILWPFPGWMIRKPNECRRHEEELNHKPWRVGIIATLVLMITILHFATPIAHTYLHQIYQRSYYIPIVLGGYWFEILGGLATAVGLGILFIIHIWHDWSHHPDFSFQQYAEIPMYLVIAVLVGYLSRFSARRGNGWRLRGLNSRRLINNSMTLLINCGTRIGWRLSVSLLQELPMKFEIRSDRSRAPSIYLDKGCRPKIRDLNLHKSRGKKWPGWTDWSERSCSFRNPRLQGNWQAIRAEIVDAACRLVADQASRQGIEIIREGNGPAAMILVDPEQIKQVLINIFI